MSVTAIVQARLGSSRLPWKALLPAADLGRPLLVLLLERAEQAYAVDRLGVATTDRPLDDLLCLWSEPLTDFVFRGSEQDVLGRFAMAAGEGEPDDLIVRLTGDCPLVCPEIIDLAVESAQERALHYLRTGDSYPEGLDVEVFTRATLAEAAREATSPAEREHVTLWMRRHTEAQQAIELPVAYGRLRLTVDEPVDYDVVCEVLRHVGPDCTLQDLLWLAGQHPEVFTPNAHVPRNAGLAKSLHVESSG